MEQEEYVLFYSKFSQASVDSVKWIRNNGFKMVQELCIDNSDVRELVKRGGEFTIKYVPTLLVTQGGRISLFQGPKVQQYLQQLRSPPVSAPPSYRKKRKQKPKSQPQSQIPFHYSTQKPTTQEKNEEEYEDDDEYEYEDEDNELDGEGEVFGDDEEYEFLGEEVEPLDTVDAVRQQSQRPSHPSTERSNSIVSLAAKMEKERSQSLNNSMGVDPSQLPPSMRL